MATDVKVRFIGAVSFAGKGVTRDMTVGRVYNAKMPVAGERDPNGLLVQYDDELWIIADDVGDHVVTQLSDGFELVQMH